MKYTIAIPPITKKNSQRILLNRSTGKPFISQSQQYREYERQAIYFLRPKPATPITVPVNVKMVFYMPTRRKVDVVNLEESCLDILVHAGILADDNSGIVVSMDGSRVEYDKARPRTEVEICPIA